MDSHTDTQFKIDPATRMDGRKISPAGVVTLPFAARLALGFVKGKAARLDIVIDGSTVKLAASRGRGPNAVRSSPRGLLQLPADAHRVLTAKGARRYRLTIDAQHHEVSLGPAA
jgi:hypothetical protein